MTEEKRTFRIERRGAGPYMGPRGFAAVPQAGTGIERSLGVMVKSGDKLTALANKTYLEARALAPAIRLIPGLGPVMAGATIAVGRGFAVSIAELKTANLAGLRGIEDILGGVKDLFTTGLKMFKAPPAEWRQTVFTPMIGTLKGMAGGLGSLSGVVLRILPIIGLIGGGIMAIFSISKLFRSLLGSLFGIVSAIMDILLLPLIPFMMPIFDVLLDLIPIARKIANFLTPGVMIGGIVGTLLGGLIGFLTSGPMGAFLLGIIGGAIGTAMGWLIDTLGAFKGIMISVGAGIGAILGFLAAGPLGAVIGAIIGGAIGALIAFWEDLWTRFKNLFATMIQWILRAVFGVEVEIGMVRAITNKVLDTFAAIQALLGGFIRFQAGISYVPRTMPAIVHRGEAIVPAAVRPYLGMHITNYFILGSPMTSGGIEQRISSELEQVIRRVV